MGFVCQAFAVQMTAVLVPSNDSSQPVFTGVRFILLKYDPGSPLFNFQPIGIPMDRWHFLFDPTGSLAGVAGSGFTEQGGAKAVSIYSLGESSFREGTFTEQTSDSTATIANTPVQVHSSTPPPSA